MFEMRTPKYQWGQRVAAQIDLFNDGSYPEMPEDALLVALGTPGEIVQIGHHEEANLPIYMVEFSTERPCVVGVMEEEIAPL
ncbi:nitrogen fixation protein NifZ [Uliginosibacterium sediminicola]|jgi:nitrogen fixation protein NifZ|uniref:Nitrogen fixation protein NifZ n=1 Tax=Uliginosibacterium sediminicola TaxID=2024550 RepID=A0ABU9Z1W7_9RHOO